MPSKIKLVMFTGFLFSFHLAFVSYVNSSFLSNFLPEQKVGLIFVFGSMLSVLTLLLVPRILPRFGGYKFLVCAAAANALALLVLSTGESAYIVVPTFVVYWVLNALVVFALDETLEILSEGQKIGRLRGIYLTILSSAWVVAQLLSSQILKNIPIDSLYQIGFCIMLMFSIFALFGMKNMPDPEYDKLTALRGVKKFFRNKNLARAYGMSFLLQFFYSWMVIYTPIYLSEHLGFAWSEISLIFSVMLSAFVLIQYPLGNYSDKIGERGMLMSGFLIAALSTFAIFFVSGKILWLWAAILFSTRVGAATIEVLNDVYFFKHINKENDEFIGIYRNTSAIAYIVGPLSASALLLILPDFKYIYPALAAVMLLGTYLASTIKKTDI